MNTAADRPKRTALARSIASSSVAKRYSEVTGRTPPRTTGTRRRRRPRTRSGRQVARRDRRARRRQATVPPSSRPRSIAATTVVELRSLTNGPTSVSGSVGSPTLPASIRASSSLTEVVVDRRPGRRSGASPCTSVRRTRTRRRRPPATARSSSASSATISGLWPPSSSWTRLPRRVASSRTPRPTGTEPVNEIARTRGSRRAARRPPTAADHHVEHAPGSSASSSARREVQTGQRRVLRELQHDSVAVRQRRRQLPGGDRRREVPRCDQADDPERPPAREHRRAGRRLLEDARQAGASPRRAKKRKICAARAASRRDSRSGLPISRVMSWAISSTRCLDHVRGARQDRPALRRRQLEPRPGTPRRRRLPPRRRPRRPELGNSPTTSDGRQGL